MMDELKVTAGKFAFNARLESAVAPKTCAMFRDLLPYKAKIIHVRWSGEGVWIPLGEKDFGLGYENATSHPLPGQMILYPGGLSETEMLLSYGPVSFSSKVGQLAGSHFLTLVSGLDQLQDLGRTVLWKGALDILFENA